MRRVVPFVLIALLAACQTGRYEGNEDSPYYVVPTGSTLVLRREITIPPEQVGVFLQYGQIVGAGYGQQLNQYYPHCKFEVRERKDVAQTVRPDEFIVTKATQLIDFTVDSRNLQVAGANVGIGIGIGIGGTLRSDGSTMQVYVTRLNLHSERQPGVFRLSCGQWEYPPSPSHVTIAQIRKALGEVFTLRIPAR